MLDANGNTFTYECLLYHQKFSSKSLLLKHEESKHRNNKVILHHTSLFLHSPELIIYYQDAFIILIKKRLGFNRHSVGSKRLSIDAFPETIFVHLFENEPTFRHSENITANFKGRMEKQILNYEHWNFWQDSKIKTKGYVLFVNYERRYKVNFSWSLLELNENARNFKCGTATCTFIIDSGEFVDENKSETNESLNTNHHPLMLHTQKYGHILPRTPLQKLYIDHTSIISLLISMLLATIFLGVLLIK